MKFSFKIVITLVAVAFIAAALFSQGSFQYQQNKQESRLCKNCHEMKPNVYTWEFSSHNRVGCLKCHSDIQLFNFTYKHVSGIVAGPVEKTTFMPNAICEDCHSQRRAVTPTQGIIFPHQLHLVKGIDCVDCHSGVTHYSVNEKAVAGQINLDQFASMAALKLSKETITMEMEQCLVCHNGAKAPNNCKACHVKEPVEGQQSSDKI